MLSPTHRTWLRHGARKDGSPVDATYAAVLRGSARAAVTEAFSDLILILQTSDVELREHVLGQLEQFERLQASLKPGEPAARTEKPITAFEGEDGSQ